MPWFIKQNLKYFVEILCVSLRNFDMDLQWNVLCNHCGILFNFQCVCHSENIILFANIQEQVSQIIEQTLSTKKKIVFYSFQLN